MKHVLTFTMMVLFLGSAMIVNGQNLKKANKEFELYAFNLAIKSYREVLSSEPTNVEALSRIAECYQHLNQIDDAIKWYQKAVVLEGVSPTTIFNYAQALKSRGKYEEAKKWFLRYAEGNPYYGNHYAETCDFAQSLQGVPSLYRVKKEYLNKSASDFGPAFYKDQVVYSSARTDLKREDGKSSSNWTGKAKNQLFITSRDNNGYLEQPTFLRGNFRSNYNEGPVSYSANGKWVAFTKNNFVNGTRQIPSSGMEMSIYLAEVSSGGDWHDAKAFIHNGSGYSSGYPFLDEEGNKLYFASNRPDGYGGYDIYVCFKNGDSWSSPKNLGPIVNSPGNEITPYIDNGTLYFASDWHPGLGGFDLFRATYDSNNWNRIFHLGNAVNSPRDDYGMILDSRKNIGYLTSNRLGGKGNEDLYQVSQLSDNVVIVVRNATDNSPIANATIDFSACGEPAFTTDAKGEYSFQALPGLDCKGIVSKTGYNDYSFTLTSDGRKKSQQINVLLTKEADQFLGKVLDATDNTSVAGVFVRSTNQSNGQITEILTDEDGNYTLGLMPNTTYIIRYSKMGFTDTHQRITTGDGSDRSVLGIVSFIPSSTRIPGGGIVASGPSPTTDATTGNTGETEDAGTTVEKEEPAAMAEEGYAVQIAAMGVDQKVDPSMYDKLMSIGNIYSRPEKGFKKLRVGIFESSAEAKRAQKAIAAKGFGKAFVVKERLEDVEGVEIYNILEKETPEPEPTPKATVEQPSAPPSVEQPTISGDTANEYMVRLAAYKNPQYFNASSISDLGVIEQRKSGSFTIMFLAGFDSYAQAQAAKQKANSSGFKGAYVVVEKDGKMKKVSQ